MQLSIDFCHVNENNSQSQAYVDSNRDHLNGQCQKVYDLLKSGHRLTVISAMNDHQVMSLPRRAKDLKEKGIDVKSKYINGSRIKEYFL